MWEQMDLEAEPSRTESYQIRIKGHLGPQWAEWFEGLTITLAENGETLLTGPVVDQGALHGLLRKVRDLGLPLIAVSLVNPKPANGPGANADSDRDQSRKGT